MLRKIVLLSAIMACCLSHYSQSCSRSGLDVNLYHDDARSDTFDILKYELHLNINHGAGEIAGMTKIPFQVLQDASNTFSLDLLEFDIDSIKLDNTPVPYSYDDSTISISAPTPFTKESSHTIEVYYQGEPHRDPSGWGGFYFSGQFAFNLGVGFADYPHNYGRAWFPCHDNFNDRAVYHFFIETDSAKVVSANGHLRGTTAGAAGQKIWEYEMLQEIPTYLACVASGPYEVVQWGHPGFAGTIPVRIFSPASDTANLRVSFQNLGGAIDAMEENFGGHSFDIVGYSLVPFSSGAMEHATNIAYPRAAVNGSLNFESLMAHELAHHWFGDLVTCEAAEDMWLNEGWASYCEYLFFEKVYDRERMMEEFSPVFADVKRTAHLDEGHLAVSGIGPEHTYGTHVYQKGALVAHSLRGYMGDENFFSCVQEFLSTHAFKDVNSNDLRDCLSECSGMDLNDFFQDWVFQSGFPNYSTKIVGQEGDQVLVKVVQRKSDNPELHSNAPLQLTLFDSDGNREEHNIIMGR